MRQFTEDTLTDAVVARLKGTKNPRLKPVSYTHLTLPTN